MAEYSHVSSISVMSSWWVYIIETAQGRLYTGISTDPERRFEEHCATARGEKNAKGARFFRSQTPKALVYCESVADRSTASRREAAIKAMSPREKRQLLTAGAGKQ